MTVHVLENRRRPARLGWSLRTLLTRLAHAIDALVSARAAREVPEWRMREVQAEISRHRGFIEAAAQRRGRVH